MTKLRKKKFKEKEYNSYIYLRHELLEKFTMEEAVVIEFIHHNLFMEEYVFPYSKLRISTTTGISYPTVLRIIDNLIGDNILIKEDSFYSFTGDFYLYYEEILSRIKYERKTYTKIHFQLRKMLKINLSVYCLLDSYRVVNELCYEPEFPFYHYAQILNIKERTYYNYRSKLEKLKYINVTDNNVVSLTDSALELFSQFGSGKLEV